MSNPTSSGFSIRNRLNQDVIAQFRDRTWAALFVEAVERKFPTLRDLFDIERTTYIEDQNHAGNHDPD